MSTPRVADPPRRSSVSPLPGLLSPRCVALYALVFVLGAAWGGGWGATAGSFLVRAAEFFVDAQYDLLAARGHLTGEDAAEFAVLPAGDDGVDAIARFVSGRAGWSMRESAVPGWVVVIAPAGRRGAQALLREQGFARLVMRNRGLWLCH